jgi:predicted transcriptional regulator
LAFATAKTPRRVEAELQIKKLKIKPYIDKGLLKILNPKGRKGRLYLLTDKAKRILDFSVDKKIKNKDWDLIGRILASPKQKLVVLKVLDSGKRTSEEIRGRAVKFNPHLSRISTKKILNDLVKEALVLSEMKDRKRFYWISENGKKTLEDLESLF